MNKKIIAAQITTISPYDFDKSLKDIRTYINGLIAEHGEDAEIDYDSSFHHPYDPNPSPQYSLVIRRQETDEEYAERINREDQSKLNIEERDRKEFARLKSCSEIRNDYRHLK
jgi:hypothetical protein